MRMRLLSLSGTCLLVTACAGGGPSPLAYGVPARTEATYVHADTTAIQVVYGGERMSLTQEGVADYAVTFGAAADGGVSVRMTVLGLSATINQPMGPPIRLDEGHVEGALVFSLDRTGDVTISSLPRVADEASQMVSGLTLAHTFFPRLPGTAPEMGESWVDTVSYEGENGPGMSSELSVLEYTVVGDTVLDGRTLVNISVRGTTEVTTDLDVAGMTVHQASRLDVRGHVLWDRQSRLLHESFRSAEGSGTVNVPIAPVPLPIELSVRQHTRLDGM
jgi:hypothetical protein